MPLLNFGFFRAAKPSEEVGLGETLELDGVVIPRICLILGDVIVSESSLGRHGTLRMKNPHVISAQAQNNNGPIKYI